MNKGHAYESSSQDKVSHSFMASAVKSDIGPYELKLMKTKVNGIGPYEHYQ